MEIIYITKHDDKSIGNDDRAVLRKKNFEAFQSLNSASVQSLQYGKNGLKLKGLPPSKAYIEGCLIVCALLRANTASECNGATVALPFGYEGNSTYPTTISEFDALSFEFAGNGYQNHMFVGNVKEVDTQEVITMPSFVRLHHIENMPDNRLTWCTTKFGMSLNGTFTALPAGIFGKGEIDIPLIGMGHDIAAVGLDQNTVRMIKGGPKVVDRVAKNCGRVRGNGCTDTACRYPSLTATLGVQSIFVRVDVCSKNALEVIYVMLSPFDL
jgi:hypothetical protein